MAMCRLKNLLTVSSLHTVLLLFGLCPSLNSSVSHWLKSQRCLVFTWPSKRIYSSELASHGSLKCDPSGSTVRVTWFTLFVHKHYIEPLSNFSYRFIKENYNAIIIIIELSPSPMWYVIDRDIESNHWHDNRNRIESWNQCGFTPLQYTLLWTFSS